jgi:uncharacterized protein
VSWFGGEPLLATESLLEVSNYCRQISEGRFSYSGSITTNASLLTTTIANQLIESGVTNFHVTFDGDKEEHDLVRKDYHGRGSFDVIWGNLLQLRRLKEQFAVIIRIHLSQSNIESCERLCQRIAHSFDGDSRFYAYAKGLKRLGGKNDASLSVLTDEAEASAIANIHSRLANSNLLYDAYAAEDGLCYAGMANSFVVRWNGALQKCTVALDSDVNTVGWLREDGSMEINQDKARAWLGWFEKVEAAECPLKLFSR